MNKILVLYGNFSFTFESVTIKNIDSVELLDMDIEDVEQLADHKCGYTKLDYLIPAYFEGVILWQPENPVDPAYAAIDKMWDMKALDAQEVQP
jgi:hypothetical protein